jgi:hypothetical protein
MRILSLTSCHQLTTASGFVLPEKKCFIGNGVRLEDIYSKVFGRQPTQSEIDNLTQNTTIDPYGKKLVDGSAAEVESYFNGTPEMKQKQALGLATQAQNMQLEANKPAINTLNSTKTDLDSKYDELLKSIGTSEGVAVDRQTLATNNELARRGITSNSGIGEQEMAKSVLPVTAQFGQMKADTGVKRQGDMTSLAQMIAQLQTGNVGQALNFAQGQQTLEQQAQQIANNLQLGLKDRQLQQDQFNFQKTQPQQQANPFVTLGEGQTLYNTSTGQPVYSVPKTIKQLQSSSGGGW